jgi:hypothetical protein
MPIRRVLVALAAVLASLPDVAEATACVPGFDYAAFGKDSIKWRGGGKTDSYDSSAGAYATSGSTSGGHIGTNGDSCGAAALSGAPTTINGNIDYGSSGSACSVTGSPPATINGTASAQTTEPAFPSVTIPSVGTHQGNVSCTGSCSPNPKPLPPNQTYGSVSAAAGKTLRLDAGVYVMSSLTITGGASVMVGSGPVVIYISCSNPSTTNGLQLAGNSVTNSTQVSTNLVFMLGPACSTATVAGGTESSYAVYAPDADVSITGGSHLYGAVVGKTVDNGGGSFVHYDRALATLEVGGFACSATEISRATPIVTTLENQRVIVQGTYESPSGSRKTIATTADVATWTFPYIKGHMRARTTASISTSASTFSSGTVLFDAGATGKIPSASYSGCGSFDGTCRNVFTVTQTPAADGRSFHPPRVQLNDTNASTIGALIAPTSVVAGITSTHWQTIVRTVLSARLGGVDRSTVAVVPPSTVAGLATRPTIVYFGATDGMLHAVCASTGGATESSTNTCPSLGTELWAFMPRVQLPLVRRNMARIDGSVRVVDAFGDFVNDPATGTRSFRTIITFQTGSADTSIGASPAVYALDVTDPANPVVLWEYTTPATPGAAELGVGLSLAAAPTLIDTRATNLVVAQTNNGGSGGSGVVATALSLETGVRAWQFNYLYPSPPRGDGAVPAVPSSGIPGGAVGVDTNRLGFTTDIVMGDLYGNLWRLDAATGASRTGLGTPLFQFSTNQRPIGAVPAIYGDGSGAQLAAFASGGYVDPVSASWAGGTQQLIAIDLLAPGPYPISETTPAKLALVEDLATGERGFSQVLVVGEELFVTTDNADINAAGYGTSGNTGQLLRYNLTTAASSTVVVRSGASAVAADGTTLFSSAADRQQQMVTDALSTVGATVDSFVNAKLTRLLWLRTQ